MANFGKVEEKRSLRIGALRVIKVSIACAIIEDVQPASPMPHKNFECRSRLLAHKCTLGDSLSKGHEPVSGHQV
jgi:hypothetical protein